MIVLEVELNGQKLVRAGREDLSVLNTLVNAVGVLGSDSKGTYKEKDSYELFFHVGGLSSETDNQPGNHYDWAKHYPLQIGDQIQVKIAESHDADPPLKKNLLNAKCQNNKRKKCGGNAEITILNTKINMRMVNL